MTAANPAPVAETGAVTEPTVGQQQVLDRIAVQRKRLRARRAAHAQAVAMARSTQEVGAGNEGSFVVRLAGFMREHPIAVASLVGVAAVIGPRRLVRWATLLLPLVLRMGR